MELSTLKALIETPAILIPAILKGFKPLFQLEAFKNYDVHHHNINDTTKRKKKRVKKQVRGTLLGTNTPAMITDEVEQEVTRISIPLQKLIVETATTFLTGGKVELKALPKDAIETEMLEGINEIWRYNKLQYRNGTLAEYMMSQTEVAEVWFTDQDEDGADVLKMNIFAPSDGYTLVPIFDNLKNLIGFGIMYTQKDDVTNKKYQYFDLYTKDELRKFVNAGQGWVLINLPPEEEGGQPVPAIIELNYGKIPVIYYSQPRSEWYDVQSMIDRLETLLSNHGDTNDYSGSPVLFAKGEITSLPDKGEPGKVVQSKNADGDLKYVTPENATESYKLEVENLKNFIMLCTQTPDLSLESLKGLGQIPSGAAFERLLIATYMKARRKQTGSWGEGVQRRVNFLKSAKASMDARLKPARKLDINLNYQTFSIDDVYDRITNAMLANGNKAIMSQEESIKFAGLSDDPEQTYKDVKAEADALEESVSGL